MSARKVREQQAARLAARLGLDPAALIAGAEAAWSNLNPQSAPYDRALSIAAAVLQAASPAGEASPRDRLQAAVDGLTPWAWQAVRGRIILGWLVANEVEIGTLNDKPFAGFVNVAALREGITGLVSAGPMYEIVRSAGEVTSDV